MKSAEEYASQVQAILEGLETGGRSWEYETVPEARLGLERVQQTQEELQFLKEDVNTAIKEIRSAYKAKKANVQTGFWSFLAGKKAEGRERTRKREELQRQEEVTLAPYTDMVQSIDEAVLGSDKVKLFIEEWIAENQTGYDA